MGMSAIAYTTRGNVVVLGMTEVSMHRCAMPQVEMCVSRFVSKVLNHRSLRRWKMPQISVIPIVECKNPIRARVPIYKS
jgi:hypothetical protein